MSVEKFTIKTQHIKLLKRLNVTWNDSEYGAPTVDPKRPYGNSDVITDIIEILNIAKPDEDGCFDEPEETLAERLHLDMQTVLEIVFNTGKIKTGTYKRKEYGNWKPI
jgi:hypothetical protein